MKRREPNHLSPTLSSEEVLRAGSLSSEEVSLNVLSSEVGRSRANALMFTNVAICAVAPEPRDRRIGRESR